MQQLIPTRRYEIFLRYNYDDAPIYVGYYKIHDDEAPVGTTRVEFWRDELPTYVSEQMFAAEEGDNCWFKDHSERCLDGLISYIMMFHA